MILRQGKKGAIVAAVAFTVLLSACGGYGASDETSRVAVAATAEPRSTPGVSSYLCMSCHSQPGIVVTGAFGVGRDLPAVAPDRFYTSVHKDLQCVDCHEEQSSLPHLDLASSGKPIAKTTDGEVCGKCHADAADGFLDSVHGTVIRLGDDRAPGCTDCHSAHYVQAIGSWSTSARAEACGRCHEGADEKFAGSFIHREPTPSRLPVDYLATRFFSALVVAVVGVGILHVELDMLRWIKEKFSRRRREDK